jgi:GNAT superfamily N-acetyltransferase
MGDPYRTGDTPPEAAKDDARRRTRQKIEALEARREELLAEGEEQAEEERLAYLEQEVSDRERQRELEREHGYSRVLSVPFDAWKPDAGPMLDDGAHVQASTRFVCLLPEARGRQFKLMQRALARLKDDRAEQAEEVERMAKGCIRYPHPEQDRAMYQATINLAPAILGNLASQMIDKVAGRERDIRKK